MTPISLENRAVLAVDGPDAASFLQGLITHDVTLLAPGRGLFAGLLSPQGKALFDFHLHAGEAGAILIDVATDKADALLKRLSMYKLRKAVTLARRDDLAVLASWPGGGPADARTPALGARWIDAAGSAPADAATYEAHRLAIGVPDSADIGNDELLWLETGADLLDGVSFIKGCYVGQENTARMHHRDKVRRRLVPVTIAGDSGEATEVKDGEGRACGKLRSRRGDQAIVHLRLEAADAPLFLGDAALSVRRPTWLESAW
ncbi:CAF17-like 4Fe-4S cluster assembly/insertion protein YgfZ [Sandarakinorhabdus oryzae]|uniref:CAF17-like 4Fe-4S cluster assembly/insertion protein YgfZ n=1 Tax=Sandarakinorhabdus oryzae TaxID=2675220 RepID=UPI0012E0CC7E|nr:folate-binding protein YgfZ [Sandarakinorhabdus oryzae]